MSEQREVVIVGAGFGGLGCVDELMKSSNEDIHVTLIDASETMSIGACWQFVWSGRTSMDYATWNRNNLKAAKHPRVTCLFGPEKGLVSTIDMDGKLVVMANGDKISFDCLVLSPGVVSDPSKVAGLQDVTPFDVCKPQDTDRIQSELDQLVQLLKDADAKKLTIMMSIMRMPYKCPPVVFEIISLLNEKLHDYNVRDKARLVVTVPVDFPFAGPPAKKHFVNLMNEMGVEYWNCHEIESVEATTVQQEGLTSSCQVNFKLKDGSQKSTHVDSLFCTMPQRAPDWVLKIPGIKVNKLDLIPVDLQTNRLQSHPYVYVIGDACHTMFPKPNKPHPKAGAFAYHMGQHVAQVMANQLHGLDDPPPPTRIGVCEAEVGLNNKGVRISPDFTGPLQNPAEGMPKFGFQTIDDACALKVEWVNQILVQNFAEYEKFTLTEIMV